MATIGSLTLGTPSPDDYMVIENDNGNFYQLLYFHWKYGQN